MKVPKVSWADEMNIDQRELLREDPEHPRQKQIMRYHEQRAARYEDYRRLIALDRWVAAEELYWSHYEKITREMAEYMGKPLPPGILERDRERGTDE